MARVDALVEGLRSAPAQRVKRMAHAATEVRVEDKSAGRVEDPVGPTALARMGEFP
jgi:hypothetical protein